jgi:hypothetical protein
MGGETSTPQRCIPNMKTIRSKLWSVLSGNQTVSGGGGGDGGGGRDQNQSIPDFVRGYYYLSFMVCIFTGMFVLLYLITYGSYKLIFNGVQVFYNKMYIHVYVLSLVVN